MTRSAFDYSERRARQEEELAASATHPLVKATHEKFAAAYRAQAVSLHALYKAARQPQEVHAER